MSYICLVKGSGTLSIPKCPWKGHVLCVWNHSPHPYAILELGKVGKVSTKTLVSQLYAFSLYVLVISVPDPLWNTFLESGQKIQCHVSSYDADCICRAHDCDGTMMLICKCNWLNLGWSLYSGNSFPINMHHILRGWFHKDMQRLIIGREGIYWKDHILRHATYSGAL